MTEPPILVDTHTLLAAAVQQVGAAQRNLTIAARSGLPETAVGNGDPGGGTNISTTSSTERTAMAGSDYAEQTLARLHKRAEQAANLATTAVIHCTGQTPINPWPATFHRTIHAYRCTTLLIDGPWHHDHSWTALHTTADALASICRTWAADPRQPGVEPHELDTELTGMWCISCIRFGVRNPRYRNEPLCGWCRSFKLEFGIADGEPLPEHIVNARLNSHTRKEQNEVRRVIETWHRQRIKPTRRRRKR